MKLNMVTAGFASPTSKPAEILSDANKHGGRYLFRSILLICAAHSFPYFHSTIKIKFLSQKVVNFVNQYFHLSSHIEKMLQISINV